MELRDGQTKERCKFTIFNKPEQEKKAAPKKDSKIQGFPGMTDRPNMKPQQRIPDESVFNILKEVNTQRTDTKTGTDDNTSEYSDEDSKEGGDDVLDKENCK